MFLFGVFLGIFTSMTAVVATGNNPFYDPAKDDRVCIMTDKNSE